MTQEEYNIILSKEGNNFHFNHLGCFCYGLRNDIGSWCGYVAFNTKYDIDPHIFNVHGGITYNGKVDKNELNRLSPFKHDVKEGYYVLGFDCAHFGDICPMLDIKMNVDRNTSETYRDKEYVINECKKLAKQINETYDDINLVSNIFKKLNKS